jgi:hypothetical protein
MSEFDSYSVFSPDDGVTGHRFSSEIGGNILVRKFKVVLRLITEEVRSSVDHCLVLTSQGLQVGEAYYTSTVHDFGGGQGMTKVRWFSQEDAGSKVDNDTAGVLSAKVIEVRAGGTPPVLDIAGDPWVNDRPPDPSDVVWGTSGSLGWVFVANEGVQGFDTSTGTPVPLPQGRYVQFRVRLVGPSGPFQHKFNIP